MQILLPFPVLFHQPPNKMDGLCCRTPRHESELFLKNRHIPPYPHFHHPLLNFHSMTKQLGTPIVVTKFWISHLFLYNRNIVFHLYYSGTFFVLKITLKIPISHSKPTLSTYLQNSIGISSGPVAFPHAHLTHSSHNLLKLCIYNTQNLDMTLKVLQITKHDVSISLII